MHIRSRVLAGLLLILVAAPVHAAQIVPAPGNASGQLTEFRSSEIWDLRTDGEYIYWWDSEEGAIVFYEIESNTFFKTKTDKTVLDLHIASDKLVYQDTDRSEGFILYDTVQKTEIRVETERPVDTLACFNGNTLGYVFENELRLYSFLSGQEQVVSEEMNPNYAFCDLFDRFVSFNDQRSGGSVVYLKDLLTGEETRLSGENEGRSSVIIGTSVYYDEMGIIYRYEITTKETTQLFEGSDLGGYLGGTGVHFLTYTSRQENGLPHSYLGFPQYGFSYRMGSIDRFHGAHAYYNGIMTWVEFQDGKMAIFAANFKNFDSDSDRLVDFAEFSVYGTDPFNADSDGDGYPDGTEVENGYDPNLPPAGNPTSPVPAPTTGPAPSNNDISVNPNAPLIDRVAGRILLQVESKGEAWYVDPVTRKRYYMKDGQTAYEMMRKFGLGITTGNLLRVPDVGAPAAVNKDFVQGLSGRILLQVEGNGEAWYVDPVALNRVYLKDGQAAYQLMRQKGLGISNEDLSQIPVGTL